MTIQILAYVLMALQLLPILVLIYWGVKYAKIQEYWLRLKIKISKVSGFMEVSENQSKIAPRKIARRISLELNLQETKTHSSAKTDPK